MVLIIHWILSAISLLLVAHLVPGFHVQSFGTALIAALVIGLVNGTIGLILKILTIPISILTFGLFLLVINALMLEIASALVSGFMVASFGSAFIGAIVLAVLNALLRSIAFA